MDNKYYYCYSYPQKKYLMDNGEYVIVKGINPNSQKRYWVFERSDKLNNLLTEWKTRRS